MLQVSAAAKQTHTPTWQSRQRNRVRNDSGVTSEVLSTHKSGPFSKAGGLKKLLSAEPGITANERKTTQTNEQTSRKEDGC